MWMSHVTCECVMSYTRMSLSKAHPKKTKKHGVFGVMPHTRMSYVVWHVNESRHMWMSNVTCQWVMAHVNTSCRKHALAIQRHVRKKTAQSLCKTIWRECLGPVTHIIHEKRLRSQVRSHTWTSHVPHEWFMSHVNESCLPHGSVSVVGVMPHTRMSYVACEWVMSHVNE